MLMYSPKLPDELLEQAKSIARVGVSTLEKSQAILCAGKHGTNMNCEQLFSEHFSAQAPYPVQRALIIAIQELPSSMRDKLYDRAIQINSDHIQLIDFLRENDKPYYGEQMRAIRHCKEEPREVKVFLRLGIGLVKGERTTFRLSRSDYDYE
jgi:hypothetical protein